MATPLFIDDVLLVVRWTLVIITLALEGFAFLNCLVQRPDSFAAIGTLPKGAWLAITAGSVLVTLLLGPVSILGIVAVVAAAIYLLDVRPALREATDGRGPW
jgi:hypothetical protein